MQPPHTYDDHKFPSHSSVAAAAAALARTADAPGPVPMDFSAHSVRCQQQRCSACAWCVYRSDDVYARRIQQASNDSVVATALVALADGRAVRRIGSDRESVKRSPPPSASDRERDIDGSGGGGGGGGGGGTANYLMSEPLVERCTGPVAGGTDCYCRLTRTELTARGLRVCADCTHSVGHHSEPMSSLMSLWSATFQQQRTQPVRRPSTPAIVERA